MGKNGVFTEKGPLFHGKRGLAMRGLAGGGGCGGGGGRGAGDENALKKTAQKMDFGPHREKGKNGRKMGKWPF